MTRFGEFIKEKRLENRITLRQFCRIAGLDSSNWSKTERGVLLPPKKKEELARLAKLLNITEGSDDWHTLFELATIGHMPAELLNDTTVLDKLPVFFRTVRGKKPTSEELGKLFEIIMPD